MNTTKVGSSPKRERKSTSLPASGPLTATTRKGASGSPACGPEGRGVPVRRAVEELRRVGDAPADELRRLGDDPDGGVISGLGHDLVGNDAAVAREDRGDRILAVEAVHPGSLGAVDRDRRLDVEAHRAVPIPDLPLARDPV